MVVVVLLGGDISMDFNQLWTVIFAIGTTIWIPIWALFEGVAKCIRALKGTDVTMEEFRSNKNHEWSDFDDEDYEDLKEDKPKEENNTMEQKTKRTRVTTKATKDSSEQK